MRRALLIVLGFSLASCASYSDQMRDTQIDISAGRSESAVQRINSELEVDRSEELPKDLEGDRGLLLLERGTLLQGEMDYKGSSRDLEIADQQLDWLDIDPAVMGEIGQWLYSDDSGPYKSPAYERMLLNVINMINYMVRGDFQGAKVEARRFQIMESYYLGEEGQTVLPELLSFGNYMAGLAFEGARSYRYAARYYSRAWHFGERSKPFRERLTALYRVTGYKGQELDSRESGLDVIRAEAMAAGGLSASEYRTKFVAGEMVVVVQSGIAPYKKAERVPIGMALTWAARYPIYFSASSYQQANQLMVSGALTWVNFPILTSEGLPPQRSVTVKVAGQPTTARSSVDVGRQVQAGWDDISGPLMAAAITRMIVRAVAGAATREITEAAVESGGNSAGAAGALGLLAQIALQGALIALDTPDTRSWSTLPASIMIVRTKTEPLIDQEVEVGVGNRVETRKVATRNDNLTVVNFSKYR